MTPLETGGLIGGLMVGLFALAGGINQILRIVDRLKERPPPAETYVSKVHCDRQHIKFESEFGGLRAEVRELRAEIKADLKEVSAANEARASKLHGRIDDLLEAVAEIRGKFGT